MLQLTVLLVQTLLLTHNAISYSISSAQAEFLTKPFKSLLAKNVSFINQHSVPSRNDRSGSDFKLKTMASPTKGIMVSDLWTAHTAKRAWATQGVSFYCKAGEVVLILGEDGMGKTRLMTSIAEIIFSPPSSARSSTLVRGTVNIAGIDLLKHTGYKSHREQVGIMLNTVNSMSNSANVLSGCTLEEILEPDVTSLETVSGAREDSKSAITMWKQKNAVKIALEVTGLSTSLLPRLPSKLATVVTAYEEDLNPSTFRPHSLPLSPSEWKKVLLTKVFAQTIANNMDSLAAPNQSLSTPARSMIGSILLLDDALSYSDEVEEAKIIATLKTTGAATVLSSSRWALGRFVDRVVVLKDGKVLESGTHAELLGMGPLESFYASKWDAMTAS